jgi:hypothetical protein
MLSIDFFKIDSTDKGLSINYLGLFIGLLFFTYLFKGTQLSIQA